MPLVDLGRAAAHDAGDRDRLLGVGDHQHLRVQDALDVVQCHQPLAGPRPPRHDHRPEGVGVEGVLRLPKLQHGVVGRVHDVADRADAGQVEPSLHPERRRPDRDVGDVRGREAPAEVRVVISTWMCSSEAARSRSAASP